MQPQTMQQEPRRRTSVGSGGARAGAGRPKKTETAVATAQNVTPFPGQNAAAPTTVFQPANVDFTRAAVAQPVEDIPLFLQRSPGDATAPTAPGNGGGPFGNAGAPPADLAKTLDMAMSLNTQRSE